MILYTLFCNKILKSATKHYEHCFNYFECQKFYSIINREKYIMKYLNVAEKHDAAKNIANILSNGSARRREGFCVYNKIFDFETNIKNQNCKMVMTSVSGHLLNYEFLGPYKSWNNCSPEQLFDAPIRKTILNNDTGEKIKKTLEKEVKSCQGLIIWTDCDREGENIGFEILEICKAVKPTLKVFRAKFSEITRSAILRAVNNLVQPDQRQNEAVNIRQELDLRTGAAFTRYQTLRLQKLFPETTADKLISYGSCQIPTLGFVAERYKEAEDFVSEPFWKLVVTHTIDDLTVEFNWARNRLFNKEVVEDYLLLCLTDPKAKVENKSVKPKNKWRPQPMDTVELEKLGSRKLKINAKEIMNIAEKLYNKGFISYPRTETNSFSLNFDLSKIVQQHTSHSEWGDFALRVLQWQPNPRNGKKTDEAHPPIHPIKLTTDLSGNEARVYELIVRHFLACVSRDATGSETIVHINIAGEKFSANGLVIYERNYLDVYPYENWNSKQIHHYDVEQEFDPTEISMREGSTTAPPLLTEADLIALMEKNGIGTDATHAEHIHTIKERGYIGEVDRGLLVPGTIGMGLYEGYGAMDLELAKPRLRAEFESDLKKICTGEKDSKLVLREQIARYKEAYHLITQRITAMDEKFSNRVNETPANRRNNGDQDPRNDGAGGSSDVNGNNDNDDDDGDDGNIPPGCGGNNFRNVRTDSSSDGIPSPLQELFLCPKCKTCYMVLKKKKEGNSYMIGCSNFPVCKNVIWLTDGIKEAQLSHSSCKRCYNKNYKSSISNKIEFKFKNSSYLALLGSTSLTYTTCLRCDSKFREIFDINLDQVKFVGAIVGENTDNLQGSLEKTERIKSAASVIKQNKESLIRTFTTNTFKQSNMESNIDSFFEDDFFDNHNFDDQFDEVFINLEPALQSNNEPNENNLSTKKKCKTFKSQQERDAYFTGWNKSSKLSKNPIKLDSMPDWGSSFTNGYTTSTSSGQVSNSKWIDLSNVNNENNSNNWFNIGYSTSNKVGEPFKKKYKKDVGKQTESLVKCKTCNELAKKQVVKKEGPNKGREFYCCNLTCNFFQWAEDSANAKSKNEEKFGLEWGYGLEGRSRKYEQQCNCNKPAIIRQVRKEGLNHGRSYYVCSNQKCSFFKWFENEVENLSEINNFWGPNKRKSSNSATSSKKRKCGLCRMEGHTKNKCPRQEEF
ncbi:DNA topoisomerase 3-alpha [Condylostylus longicornis]|uniref:DNA topoisomerase 3-alpha n=1 Tax=Condylostylus longicornis TaxID=2530218 RepID=UPI00244E271A|nr:DNA topoisomerase 3-alpha [Condylostylus longicornis]